jgi:hypothetical protein
MTTSDAASGRLSKERRLMYDLRKALIGGALGFGLLVQPALAAGFFTNGVPPAGGTQYPYTLPLTGNELIPADTQLSGGAPPQSEAISTGQLASVAAPANTPRNLLSNGQMAINQQGTATVTGGTTSITALQFAADRWFVDTNVGSGAGQAAVITASPAPPAGFAQSVKMWRNSGALTQPVCMLQEINPTLSASVAGKYVVLSAYAASLAGLTSTGGLMNAYVIYGTGAEQGLGTLTASPAITPAWTNITSSAATNWALTTTFGRFYTPPILIPAQVSSSNVTEVGVELCFTPVGSSSGATDGIALTGIQLEAVQYSAANAVLAPPGPSAFEFHTKVYDLADAEQNFYQLNEPASTAAVNAICEATGATAGACTFPLPVLMRGTTPVVVIPTTGTFKVNIAGTATTWTTPTAGVCSTAACQITIANTNTAGQVEVVTGGGGSGVVYVKSDVIY